MNSCALLLRINISSSLLLSLPLAGSCSLAERRGKIKHFLCFVPLSIILSFRLPCKSRTLLPHFCDHRGDPQVWRKISQILFDLCSPTDGAEVLMRICKVLAHLVILLRGSSFRSILEGFTNVMPFSISSLSLSLSRHPNSSKKCSQSKRN
jgi:hypothetical protein